MRRRAPVFCVSIVDCTVYLGDATGGKATSKIPEKARPSISMEVLRWYPERPRPCQPWEASKLRRIEPTHPYLFAFLGDTFAVPRSFSHRTCDTESLPASRRLPSQARCSS